MDGLLTVTLKRYEESEAPGLDGNQSTMYWFTMIQRFDEEIIWERISHAVPWKLKMKMKMIHDVSTEILEPLVGCESVAFEFTVDG